ncbi:MAG: putative transcription factor, like protein [Cyanobacteria bacterium RYN_339]|nr:putative transcription factor, like protein [Cyanobacteria bacterium RYN_339]
MISNERQYNKTKQSLEEFRAQLEESRRRYADDPVLLQLQTGQLVRYIEDFEHEIADYVQATNGDLAPIMPAFNPRSGRLEIARALTKMRLAKGLTQEELATRLGTHQPSITRWENEEYESYRLGDLRKVASVLGRDLDVVFIERQAEAGAPAGRPNLDSTLEGLLEALPALKSALSTPEAREDLRTELKRAFRTLAEEMLVAEAHRKEVG